MTVTTKRPRSRVFRAMIWLDHLQLNTDVSKNALLVGLAIASAEHRKTATANPSLAQIVRRTRLSKSAVCVALTELEEAGMIRRDRRYAADDPTRECLRTHYQMVGVNDDEPADDFRQPCPYGGQQEEDKSSSNRRSKTRCASSNDVRKTANGDIAAETTAIERAAEPLASNDDAAFHRMQRQALTDLSEAITPLDAVNDIQRWCGLDIKRDAPRALWRPENRSALARLWAAARLRLDPDIVADERRGASHLNSTSDPAP